MILPAEILKIIDDYVHTFSKWGEVPSLRRIRSLIRSSNARMMVEIAEFLFITPDLYLSPKFTYMFQADEQTILALETAVHLVMNTHWQTAALFWLFLENSDFLWHGPYIRMFRRSLFWQTLELILLPKDKISELGFVCLSRAYQRLAVEAHPTL